MVRYKVKEVKLDGDQVGIILEGKPKILDKEMDDSFAVWIPAEEYQNMTMAQITDKLKEEIQRRVEYLEQIELEKQQKEEQYKDTVDMTSELVKATELETGGDNG